MAGSERAGQTGAEGLRLKEGGHINKSLLALSTVIGKLAESGTPTNVSMEKNHIPFRDSKLTRILQPSLGGNGKTAIICTLATATEYTDETLSTLKFASRAKCIQNKPIVNTLTKQSSEEVRLKHQQQISLLVEQLDFFKQSNIQINNTATVEMQDLKREMTLLQQVMKLLQSDIVHSFGGIKSIIEKKSSLLFQKMKMISTEKEAYANCYEDIENDYNKVLWLLYNLFT